MARAWLLLAAALLTACANPSLQRGEPGEPAWTTGRLSLRIDATPTQSAQSTSAAFELRGDGRTGELRLNSPFGSRLATARWAPGEAVLASADGDRRFDSLDALSATVLGQALPLAALPAWLAGTAWDGAPSQAGAGGFEQLGWQILTARRTEGWIEARRSAPPALLLRVKLDDAP